MEHKKEDSMTLCPLTPAIGAVVGGIDLSLPLSSGRAVEIKNALLSHQVLFFENQLDLTPDLHIAFAKNFGNLHAHPFFPHHEQHKELIVFKYSESNPADSDVWHLDMSFDRRPAMGCILRAVHIPPVGGDTCWSSMTAAYNGLSGPFQKFIDGLTATNDFSKRYPLERWGPGNEEKGRAMIQMFPPVRQPVVRVHPFTGKKGIFSAGFRTKLNELNQDESDVLGPFLINHIAKPEYTVRWRWKNGDVAFWDNRCTLHYALNDYLPERRTMHRATIEGDVPYGPLHELWL